MKQFVDFHTYNKANSFGQYDAVYYPATHHHLGSDFLVPIGTPIIAPTDGDIIKTSWNDARGNTAVFDFLFDGEWGLELCHLRELPPLGTFKQGQVIAKSGNTGTATTGPHLHVVMHKDAMVTKNYKELIDEAAFFRLVAEGRLVDPFEWFKVRLTPTRMM